MRKVRPGPTRAALSVQPSGIREIFDLAWGRPDMLHLEVGEPDFPTPPHIVEAAFAAARAGSGYTNTAGLPALREAVVERLASVHGLDVGFDRVLINHGAVQGIALIVGAMVEAGDEVLMPDPGWPNYEMLIRGAGAIPVRYPLRASKGFVPDPDEVASLMGPRTKVLIVCSPGNPTGSAIPTDVIGELVGLTRANGVLVLSDEVYDEIVFDGRRPESALHFGSDDIAGVWSCSKTYAMTGWRVGYTATPPWLTPTLVAIQESTITCASSVSQAAALEALTGPQACVASMRDAYERRRDLLLDKLAAAGIEAVVPTGAFYLMLPLHERADARAAAIDLVGRGVAVAPGGAFGEIASNALRISLAASEDTIERATERIVFWYEETDGGRVRLRASP